MLVKNVTKLYENRNTGSFNLTPVIDIVFLLILFFLVVCQFIEAENFPVNVPDDCNFAQDNAEQKSQITTVTVVKGSDNNTLFVVDAEQINAFSNDSLVSEIAGLLNKKLKNLPSELRIVTLRIDKDIYFAEAQFALAGIAESIATNIKLAALKGKSVEID